MESHLKILNSGLILKTFTQALSLLRLMEFSVKFDKIKSGWSIVYIEKLQNIIFK